MPVNCFIKGCSSKKRTGESHLSFFTPPKDNISAWRKVVPNGEELKTTHIICELHFNEGDVCGKYNLNCIDNNLTVTVEKTKPRLVKGALPSKFLNTEQNASHCEIQACRENITSLNDFAITIINRGKSVNAGPDKNVLHNNEQSESLLNQEKDKLNEDTCFVTICEAAASHSRMLFSYLGWVPNIVNDGYKEKCLMFTKYTDGYLATSKRILLLPDLTIKIFVEEVYINEGYIIVVESVDQMKRLIEHVTRNISPCRKINGKNKSENCYGYVLCNGYKKRGRPHIKCSECFKDRQKLIRSERKEQSNQKYKMVLAKNKNLHRVSRRLKDKVKRLKAKIESLRIQCSKRSKDKVMEVVKSLPESQQAAVQACFDRARVKGKCGMRYTNQWIYECLLIRIKSRKTYNHLRRHNILTLPCFETLSRYIKAIKGSYGFDTSIFKIIEQKTPAMEPQELRGMLLADEMKLSKTISFNKEKLQMEGFTNLGKYTPEHQKNSKGDHALVIMFQPFKGKWVQNLGCFLSKGSASGTVLHQILLESIILAENAGLKIDGISCDGASWNRAMWDCFGVTEKNTSVPHPVDEKRRLWMVSDFPHLIKCLRNFFTKHRKYDQIWTPDGLVSMKHWYAILACEDPKAYALKVNYNLRQEHLNPQFYQKMNVAMAFQFFGVADAMQIFRNDHKDFKYSDGSVKFCQRVKSLITAMNSRTYNNHLKPNNEMWQVIHSFLQFLKNWEKNCKEKKLEFIPNSTCYGLKISLQATLEICQFLTSECGFEYLMTARLNQDYLERFFGMMRHCCGSNDHPDSALFIQMYKLISTYSLIKPTKGANITGSEIIQMLISLKDLKSVDERKEQWDTLIDSILDKGRNCNLLADAVLILEEHDYFDCTTSEYVLAYISGFVARKSNRFIKHTKNEKTEFCQDCLSSLTLREGEEVPEYHRLINMKTKFNLQHPSRKLFSLIATLEKATLSVIENNEISPETLFFITDALEKLAPLPLVGCDTHELSLTHNIIHFYLTTRMFFLCKQINKNENIEKELTKEKRKLAKLATERKASTSNLSTSDLHSLREGKPQNKRKGENLENAEFFIKQIRLNTSHESVNTSTSGSHSQSVPVNQCGTSSTSLWGSITQPATSAASNLNSDMRPRFFIEERLLN